MDLVLCRTPMTPEHVVSLDDRVRGQAARVFMCEC